MMVFLQVTLQEADNVCPRCGLAPEVVRQGAESGLRSNRQDRAGCPVCAESIPPGSDVCPHCQQTLCPECLAAVGEEDLACPRCRAAFEYVCPECETLVGPHEEQCPECGLVF